jgi:hypothetical protein
MKELTALASPFISVRPARLTHDPRAPIVRIHERGAAYPIPS